MNRFPLLFLLVLVPLSLHSQPEKMYEDLTRPAVQRPLSVYGGQLQVEAGYQLVTGNKYFDGSGKKTGVKEAASTNLSNNFSFSLRYGILDFVEFNASTWYRNSIASDPTVILLDYTVINYMDRMEHARGLSDLYVGLTLRLPVEIPWFDWAVSAGAILPVAASEPGEPGHTYEVWDAASGAFQVRYKDYPKYGKGVTLPQFGTNLRLSLDKFGIWLGGRYIPVSAEVETSQWKYRLVDEEFEYTSEPYLLKHPSCLNLDASVGYQAFPWFIAYASFFYESGSGGWTESTGQRIAFPEPSLALVSLNFEIQVSTHLRFIQYINFPLAGKNTWSAFSFFTGVSYSLVPLKNLYY